VAGWIKTHAGLWLNPGRWSPRTYERYLACVGHWAAELDVSPDLVEELIFRNTASGQWAELLPIRQLAQVSTRSEADEAAESLS
jgi:8-oxoguanine DNA glycosylase-like protein